MINYSKLFIFNAIIFLLYSCNTISSPEIHDSDDEEIELTYDRLTEIEKKDKDIPVSDITYEDIERAKKLLNQRQRKEYYAGLLGKKVKWMGEIERTWTDNDPMGRNHIDINSLVSGGAKIMHLVTNQEIYPFKNYANNRIVFVGYVYRIDRKGELHIKTTKID